MESFEITASINGKRVSLDAHYIGRYPDSNFDYFKIMHGNETVSIIKVDGACEIEVDSGEIDPEVFPSICDEIKRMKGG